MSGTAKARCIFPALPKRLGLAEQAWFGICANKGYLQMGFLSCINGALVSLSIFFNAIDPSSAKAIGHVMPMVESCQHSDQVNFSLSTWFGDGHQFSGHNFKSLYEHTEVHPPSALAGCFARIQVIPRFDAVEAVTIRMISCVGA